MKNSTRECASLLSRHLRPQALRFSLFSSLILAGVALRVFAPQFMKTFIDSSLAGKPLEALLWAAAAFMGTALLQQGLGIVAGYLGEKVAWQATNGMRRDLAAHALSLDMGFHNGTSPGEIIERIDGDASEVSTFFSEFALGLVSNLLLLVGIVIAVFVTVDWRAGLGFAAFAAANVAVIAFFRGLAMPWRKKQREALTEQFGFLEERLEGTEDIRSSGAVGHSLDLLVMHHGRIFNIALKGSFRDWVMNLASGSAFGAGTVAVFLLGWHFHQRGMISIGTVYLLVHYLGLVESPMRAVARQMQSFQTIGACVDRIGEFLARKPAVSGWGLSPEEGPARPAEDEPSPVRPEGAEMEPARTGRASLTFEDVSFSYAPGKPVLSGLSFCLEDGASLGLLGRTGSGKSTLARLVFRLYEPEGGRILLGGKDLREHDFQELRRGVAMVTQEVQLFRASLRDNITFFDRSVSDRKIMTALEALGLESWISGLPKGLDTMLDAGQDGLSAGEGQLLAFTRVFLRDPGLVILDEASSRLDPLTESRLERAVDRLVEGRSSIIIAHRLSSVERARDILVLESGRAVEFGRREELARRPESRFAGLLARGLEEVLA